MKIDKKKREKSTALKLHKYKDKPVEFLKEVLRVELTEEQQEFAKKKWGYNVDLKSKDTENIGEIVSSLTHF